MNTDRAELLPKPPLSGEYPEVAFGGTNDVAWVLFRPRADEDWVGRFAEGDLGHTTIASSDLGDLTVVVARGAGYAVHIETRAVAFDVNLYQLEGLIAVPSSDVIVAHDDFMLYAFSSEGLIWRSEPVALDGIRLTAASEAFVTGVASGISADAEFRLDVRNWSYSATRQWYE